MTSIETLLKASERGVIPVKLEEEVVRFRIGHLYAKPESAVRELYANELRACRTARDKHHTKPRIEVVLNMSERSLTIEGINSTGISEDNFVNILSVLGETDNPDGSEIGQFGWGVQSYTALSDSILYETHCLETGEMFAMLGIGGDHFSKLPAPTLEFPGTRVTVHVRDGIDIGKIYAAIIKVCAYSDINTRLKTIRGEGDAEGPTIINDPSLDHALPHGTKVEMKGEDFQFVGVLASVPQKQIGDVRLLRLPIEATLKLPFDAFILNIENERIYKPTADRERLTDAAVEHFQKAIHEQLKTLLPPLLEIGSFDDFRQKPHQYVYLNDYKYAAATYQRQTVWDICSPSAKTANIQRLLNVTVMTTDHNGDQSRLGLGRLVGRSKHLFLVSSLDSKLLSLLQTRHYDAAIFKLDDRRRRYEYENRALSEDIIKQQGIRTDAGTEAADIKEELKRSQTYKPTHHEPILDENFRSVVVHRSAIRDFKLHGDIHYAVTDRTMNQKLSYVDDGTVFVPDLDKYTPVLTQIYSDGQRSLSRLDKLPSVFHTKKLTLKRFLETKRAVRVQTSKGEMTFKDIAAVPDTITIMAYDCQSMSRHYSGKDMLIAIPPKEATDLAIFLIANGKEYKAQQTPDEAELCRVGGKETQRYRFGYSEGNFRDEANDRINMVYHVALAVKDDRMKKLFIAAAANEPEPLTLRKLRDFALQHFEEQDTKT
jgi:hypothetical protein